MTHTKLLFLFFALLAACSMMGIGIAVSYRSLIGIFLSSIVLLSVMGIGFTLKKKLL